MKSDFYLEQIIDLNKKTECAWEFFCLKSGIIYNGPQVKFGGDRRRVSRSPVKNLNEYNT
jgi:hypothetical protein